MSDPQIISCPKCAAESGQNKDGFTSSGSQRYRCKQCGCRYTPRPQQHGYDEEVRLQALRLYQDGLSLRAISRVLDVNHQSVANWINAYANQFPLDLPPSVLELAILDGVIPWSARWKKKRPVDNDSTPQS